MYKLKHSTTPEKLCKGLPEEFVEYIKYVKQLLFEEKPDYLYLKSLFSSYLSRNEQRNDLLFFWSLDLQIERKDNIIKKEKNENLYKRFNSSTNKRKGSAHQRLYYRVKKSLEKDRITVVKQNKSNNNLNI